MKKIASASIFVLLLGFSTKSKAQVVTDTQTINNTELNITMDKRISNSIEKLQDNCNNKNNNKITTYKTNNSKITTPTNNKKLTTAEICRENPRILGYKIQVAVVKSKEEADKIRTDFRNKFPSIKVEIDASLRPNYKILAGSYFTKDSARPDLRKIKASFSSANSVQYRVFCADAK